MSELKNMIYNCRQATYLIEKQQIGKINLREKVQLQVHLYACSVCKLFSKQSVVVENTISSISVAFFICYKFIFVFILVLSLVAYQITSLQTLIFI